MRKNLSMIKKIIEVFRKFRGYTKKKIETTKGFICKYCVWISFSVLALVVVSVMVEYLFITLFGFVAFIPFTDLIDKFIVKNERKPKILGLSFKKFLTPWIAFFGLLGIGIGIIQVQNQISNQTTQIGIQQKQLLHSRFASGVELLGNQNESARIGGAYNLYFLASEYQKEYLNPVCGILCAHIRTITSDTVYQKKYKDKPSNEIQTILNLLFKNDKNLIFTECDKNLEGAFLDSADFVSTSINKVRFSKAKMNKVRFNGKINDVYFTDATLNKSTFQNIELTTVFFSYAKLSGAEFYNATLSSVYFTGAIFYDFTMNNHVKLKKGDFRDVKLLKNVNFSSTEFREVDFSNATLIEGEINFAGTLLEGFPLDTIKRPGRSLELTKPKIKQKK